MNKPEIIEKMAEAIRIGMLNNGHLKGNEWYSEIARSAYNVAEPYLAQDSQEALKADIDSLADINSELAKENENLRKLLQMIEITQTITSTGITLYGCMIEKPEEVMKLRKLFLDPEPPQADSELIKEIKNYGGACYEAGYEDGSDKDSEKGDKKARKAEYFLSKCKAFISKSGGV